MGSKGHVRGFSHFGDGVPTGTVFRYSKLNERSRGADHPPAPPPGIGSRHLGVGPTRWLAEKIMEASDSEHEVPARIAKRLLNQLEGLQLRVYEVSGNRQSFDNAIAESVTLLKQKSWETKLNPKSQTFQLLLRRRLVRKQKLPSCTLTFRRITPSS